LCVNKSQFVPVIFEPPCTCNVRMRCVRGTIVDEEKQKVYICVSVCVCVGVGGWVGVSDRERTCACARVAFII
jgi:hypothetical protein